jgi:hypothetical protein
LSLPFESSLQFGAIIADTGSSANWNKYRRGVTRRFHTTFLYGVKKCLTKSANHVAANFILTLTRKHLNRSFVLPKHANASGGVDRNNGGGRRTPTTERMTRGTTRSGQQRIAVIRARNVPQRGHQEFGGCVPMAIADNFHPSVAQ